MLWRHLDYSVSRRGISAAVKITSRQRPTPHLFDPLWSTAAPSGTRLWFRASRKWKRSSAWQKSLLKQAPQMYVRKPGEHHCQGIGREEAELSIGADVPSDHSFIELPLKEMTAAWTESWLQCDVTRTSISMPSSQGPSLITTTCPPRPSRSTHSMAVSAPSTLQRQICT